MKNWKTFGVVALAAVSLTLTSTLGAQNNTQTYSKSYGNSKIGGSVFASASLWRYTTGQRQVGAELLARGNVNLLNKNLEVAEARGYAVSKGTGPNNTYAEVSLELLNSRVLYKRVTSTARLASFNKTVKMFPVDPRMKFPIGPVILTIKGNSGIGMSVQSTATLAAAGISARLDNGASAWGHASLSAAVGIPGVKLGVSATGKLANQTLGGNVGASMVQSFFGGVTYTVQAISVRLAAFIEIGFKIFRKWIGKRWEIKIAEFNSAKLVRTLMRF